MTLSAVKMYLSRARSEMRDLESRELNRGSMEDAVVALIRALERLVAEMEKETEK